MLLAQRDLELLLCCVLPLGYFQWSKIRIFRKNKSKYIFRWILAVGEGFLIILTVDQLVQKPPNRGFHLHLGSKSIEKIKFNLFL